MMDKTETGLQTRAPESADLKAVLDLIRTCEEADEGAAESTADDLRTDWQLPGLDLSRDAWMVVTSAERIVGYASIWQRVEGLRFESDGYTHPEFRERGIGTTLVRAVEARAREQTSAGAKLRTAVNHANDAARRLLENEGYSPARYYWQMEIDLKPPLPAPEWPDGVSPRAFQPGQDDRAVHALVQEAFADNYDYSPLPYAAWRTALIERDDFDPELFLLTTVREEIVGAALCPRYENTGWVRQLVVRHDWRRRGLGRALMKHAFAEFYRRGYPKAGLVVDSYNRTGAKEFYESLGMRVERQHDGYEKELRADGRI
jgi:mycothiol synthase